MSLMQVFQGHMKEYKACSLTLESLRTGLLNRPPARLEAGLCVCVLCVCVLYYCSDYLLPPRLLVTTVFYTWYSIGSVLDIVYVHMQ
jgi:hypothetical protein